MWTYQKHGKGAPEVSWARILLYVAENGEVRLTIGKHCFTWRRGRLGDHELGQAFLKFDKGRLLRLKQRWWRETDYGTKQPSAELIAEVEQARHETIPTPSRPVAPELRREAWKEGDYDITLRRDAQGDPFMLRILPASGKCDPEMARMTVDLAASGKQVLLCFETSVLIPVVFSVLKRTSGVSPEGMATLEQHLAVPG